MPIFARWSATETKRDAKFFPELGMAGFPVRSWENTTLTGPMIISSFPTGSPYRLRACRWKKGPDCPIGRKLFRNWQDISGDLHDDDQRRNHWRSMAEIVLGRS